MENQKAVLTLYACRKNINCIPEIAKDFFSDVMQDISFESKNSFTILFEDETEIHFHVTSKASETYVQSNGMMHFFSQAPLENKEVKQSILRQISLFNCIIGIQFELNENEQRTNYIINTIYMIADLLCAFILYPNMSLFDSDGKLLISIDGKTDFEEFYPIGSSDILEKEIEESPEDIERKNRSIQILKQKEIPYMEHLKAAALEADTTLWDKESIIKRLTAVYTACVKSEIHTSYASGYYDEKEMPQKTKVQNEIALMEEKYHVLESFSEEEEEYIETEKPDDDTNNKFGWQYECCAVFLWALSLLDLQEPTEICDAKKLGTIIWNNTLESLMEKAELRSKKEILDLQDLVFRYDWACVDARIHKKELKNLNASVIYYWHYALNWLLQVDGITDWDEVCPNT